MEVLVLPKRKRYSGPHPGNCLKCGTFRKCLHGDHIVPRYKGGSDDLSNIQYLCANCHEDKTRQDLVGRKMAPESKAKISASRKGQKMAPEVRARMMGHIVTDETKAKIRATKQARGQWWTDDARAKALASHRRNSLAKQVACGG